MGFSSHEVDMLKTNKINGLFRVAGISEYMSYLGLACYKVIIVIPFFLLLVVLGFSSQLVLFGNAGRWMSTLLVLSSYAYSMIPMGLMIAKHKEKRGVATCIEW